MLRFILNHELKIEKAILVGLVFSFPLNFGFNSVIVALALLFYLVTKKYRLTKQLLRDSSVTRMVFFFFFVIALSCIYSSNIEHSLDLLVKRLNLLIIPVVVGTFAVVQADIRMLLRVYVYMWTACIFYSFVSTLVVYNLTIPMIVTDKEIYAYFSWIVGRTLKLGSNYYSLFISFSLIYVLFSMLKSDWFVNRFVTFLIFLANFCFLAILSSRTSLLAFLIISTILLLVTLIRNKLKMTYMVVIILLYSLGLVMAYKTPYLQNRVSEVMNKGISLDPRWVTFHCGLKVFLANPLIGSGLGDVENLGLTCYEEKGFTEGIINRYHFHNEFIQIAAYSGLIGLISFCGLILSIIIRAIKKRGVIEVSFLVLFLLACQTESLLSRNKGILFFSFFSTLFFISNHEKDSTR